jgi:helicase
VPGIARFKLTDPAGELPEASPEADLRVLLPDGDEFTVLADKLSAAGAQVRKVRYLLEDEAIIADGRHYEVVSRVCRLGKPDRGTRTKATGHVVTAAATAFDVMWADHAPAAGPGVPSALAETLIPDDLVPFLPFSGLNPAQAQIVPEVLGHDQNLLVVAPTGAGKTVIGMAACLKAVIRCGRKAAWLVPQRSLTDELDRELASWRRQGLRV